jgi:hypothetical protein
VFYLNWLINKQRTILLAVICFISFLGVFLRGSLFAFDSYATWHFIRTGSSEVISHWMLAPLMFSFFPDSLLFFKIFMFASFFLSVLFLFLLVEHFFEERTAWLSILVLLATTPYMLFEFAKLENNLFAYPLLFLGILLLFKKKWYFFVPFLASLGFWVWPYYFWVSSIGYFVGALELGLFGALFGRTFLGFLFIIPFFLLRKKFFVIIGLLFTVFGLWSGHLTFFLIPIILLGIAKTLEILSSKGYDTKNVILPCVILIICFNMALFLSQPTSNDWFLVDESIKLSKDTNYPIYNEWSYGHWLVFKGYDTKYKSGGVDNNYFLFEKPFIGLTYQDLSGLDCRQTNQSSTLTRSTMIWVCD